MGKLKTQKSFSKRLTLKKSGKISRRKAGQNHFNARESRKTTRNKRKSVLIERMRIKRTVRRMLPYAL